MAAGPGIAALSLADLGCHSRRPNASSGQNPEIGDRNRAEKHIHHSPPRQVQGHQVFQVGVGGARKWRGGKGARDPTPPLLLVTIKFAS